MRVEPQPTQEELRELYRDLILEHARSPRHFGKLRSATHEAEGINPLCGDKLRLYLEIDAGGRIAETAFEGTGCAISVASASLLTDDVTGLSRDEAMARVEAVIGVLTGELEDAGIDLGRLAALKGVREFPSRVKCATLAWHALRSAVEHDSTPATTE